jgi:hypothetical protein
MAWSSTSNHSLSITVISDFDTLLNAWKQFSFYKHMSVSARTTPLVLILDSHPFLFSPFSSSVVCLECLSTVSVCQFLM